MHPMIIVGVLLHVTFFVVVAFFVLFAAQKAQGLVKLLGNVVGVWLLALAALAILATATAPMFGGRPFGMPMGGHFRMMGYDRGGDVVQPSGDEPAQPDASAPAPDK
jgi:hypothetical protein